MNSGQVYYLIFVILGTAGFLLFAHFLPWRDDEDTQEKPPHEQDC